MENSPSPSPALLVGEESLSSPPPGPTLGHGLAVEPFCGALSHSSSRFELQRQIGQGVHLKDCPSVPEVPSQRHVCCRPSPERTSGPEENEGRQIMELRFPVCQGCATWEN